MTASNAQATTVKQIKQQASKLADDLAVPPFWITDWLLYVLDKPSSFMITDEDYHLTDSELERFNAGVTKMQQGIPLAYLTGQQDFWSLNFKVNEHTLIPRPDTEVLVEQVLNWIKAQDINNKTTKRLLDLGTGSGCIAVSLAHEVKQANWQVVAIDLSLEALKVAKYNAILNNVKNIDFVQSSWYEQLSDKAADKFDIIVSNPPYIDETDEHLTRLQAEPISALSAPNQGLADIEHIVHYAPRYLRVGGLLAIEHGYDQAQAVQQLFVKNGFKEVQTIKDFGANDRVTLGHL